MSSSSAQTASKNPKPANVDYDDYSTNQEAVPLRWFTGVRWCPLTWITDIHNKIIKDIKQKVGKKKETVGHDIWGDVAGLACIGPVHHLYAIEIEKTIVWEGDYQNTSAKFTEPAALSIEGAGDFYLYWGHPDQPIDPHLLIQLDDDTNTQHPAYRNQCYLVCKKLYFGNDVWTVPSIRLLLGREPQTHGILTAPTGTSSLLAATDDTTPAPIGANPALSILDLLASPLAGLALPKEKFNITNFTAAATALGPANGGQENAILHALSPFLERSTPAKNILSNITQYINGVITTQDGKLNLSAITPRGLIAARKSTLKTPLSLSERPKTIAETPAIYPTEIAVKFLDRLKNYKETSIIENSSSALTTRSTSSPQNNDLLFLTDEANARRLALAFLTLAQAGETKITLSFRPSKATHANLASGENPAYRVGDLLCLPFLAPTHSGANQEYLESSQLWCITKIVRPYNEPLKISFEKIPASLLNAILPPLDNKPITDTPTPPILTTPAAVPFNLARIITVNPAALLPEDPVDTATIITLFPRSPSFASYDYSAALAAKANWDTPTAQIHIQAPASPSYTPTNILSDFAYPCRLNAAITTTNSANIVLTDVGNPSSTLDRYSAIRPEKSLLDARNPNTDTSTIALLIDDEIILAPTITASSTKRTITAILNGKSTRGAYGTTPATHTTAALVLAFDLGKIQHISSPLLPRGLSLNLKIQPFAALALPLEKAPVISHTPPSLTNETLAFAQIKSGQVVAITPTWKFEVDEIEVTDNDGTTTEPVQNPGMNQVCPTFVAHLYSSAGTLSKVTLTTQFTDTPNPNAEEETTGDVTAEHWRTRVYTPTTAQKTSWTIASKYDVDNDTRDENGEWVINDTDLANWPNPKANYVRSYRARLVATTLTGKTLIHTTRWMSYSEYFTGIPTP